MEIGAIIQLTLGIISAATTAFAAYQRFRARRNKDGWDMSEQSLRSVIAAIELLPSSDARVQQAKRIIRTVADGIGVEKEKLSIAVEQVRTLLDESGFSAARDETDPASIERCAAALKAVRG
ncbi:MAG: hypothetical protein ABFD60_06990 [Bryobacteraceae bacterium]